MRLWADYNQFERQLWFNIQLMKLLVHIRWGGRRKCSCYQKQIIIPGGIFLDVLKECLGTSTSRVRASISINSKIPPRLEEMDQTLWKVWLLIKSSWQYQARILTANSTLLSRWGNARIEHWTSYLNKTVKVKEWKIKYSQLQYMMVSVLSPQNAELASRGFSFS